MYFAQYDLSKGKDSLNWDDCTYEIMKEKIAEEKLKTKDSSIDLFFVTGNTIYSNPNGVYAERKHSKCPIILGPFTSFIEAYKCAIKGYCLHGGEGHDISHMVVNEVETKNPNEFNYEFVNLVKDSKLIKGRKKDNYYGFCITSYITIKRVVI